MNNINIYLAKESDGQEILDIYSYYILNTAITFEYEIPTLAEFKQRINNVLSKYPYIVAKKDEKIVGYGYVSAFHERAAYSWSVETSIYIDNNFQHLGIGKSIYEALEKIVKKQNILNLNACIAYPQQDDEYLDKNSAHFHEHLGYKLVGEFHQSGYKFNRWYNMVWYEKHIGEHLKDQPNIILFNEIKDELFDENGKLV